MSKKRIFKALEALYDPAGHDGPSGTGTNRYDELRAALKEHNAPKNQAPNPALEKERSIPDTASTVIWRKRDGYKIVVTVAVRLGSGYWYLSPNSGRAFTRTDLVWTFGDDFEVLS